MGPFLASIRVIGGPIPIVVEVLALVAALWLLLRRRPAGKRASWAVTVFGALIVGAMLGLAACWLIGDVANAFDVALSPTSRAWVAVAFAGIALAIVNVPRSSAPRRVGAVASVLVFTLVGALGVNADFGQYPTLASILGTSSFPDLPATVLAAQRAEIGTPTAAGQLWNTWQSPTGMPAKGLVGAVTIPATTSHFAARSALVYLPPAALVAKPPTLPVLVMLSGQPGSPENVFVAGHLAKIVDKFAAQHEGLAPIIVVPDQLTAPEINPMCVDGPIGKSATYLTVDVPAWIRANLDVQSGPLAWGIGGFSQGGTCAIQLGAGHPEIFGSILDISGELEPKIGTPGVTIQKGFAGNVAAFKAAKPLAVIAQHKPYSDTVAVFASGSLDTKYTPWINTIAAAAKDAGMRTSMVSSPGTAHDWYTVRYVFEHGLPTIFEHLGLVKP